MLSKGARSIESSQGRLKSQRRGARRPHTQVIPMATTAQAGAAGASGGNKRRFALAAVALVGIAAAVAAIVGTHGSTWGKVGG